MTEDRYNWLEGQARNLDRMTLVGSEIRCYCPDDCNCHYSWRPNYCGCKQHEQPTASERIRAAREATFLHDPRSARYEVSKRVNDGRWMFFFATKTREEAERVMDDNREFHLSRCPNDRIEYGITKVY